MKQLLLVPFIWLMIFSGAPTNYPIDGYETTGIRRLDYLNKLYKDEIKGSKRLKPGALFPLSSVKLNLVDDRSGDVQGIPPINSELQEKIEGLFRGLNPNYSMTIMDITEGRPIRYAQHRETAGYQPGSVGKLVVLASFFTQLSQIYPHDFDKRIELLRTKQIKAGDWALHDHHTVPIYDPETRRYSHRQVQATDVFSLYEWLDNMVSPSNNGAASVVWREMLLMNAFCEQYPNLTFEQGEDYFKSKPKSELSEMAITLVNEPLRTLGITHDEWRLGSFFTHGASSHIPGKGGSIGTPIGLMKYMIALEQGKIIDRPTSLEMKRLLYMTGRRIRYAASPALDSAAVYFKSGSLYSCDRSKGESCGQYMGNRYNYMNSVAIIEHPGGTKYMVCLMTNVLRKNSAYDHLMLASKVDKIVQDL